jgi:hypothetical protein
VAKKYPLEPLVTLLREREKARAGTVRDALERAEAETRAERERERAAFDDQGVRVRDLQQSELFRIGAERALGALAVSESERAARASTADQAVLSARSELARVNRDKQVVERHRARFDAEEERRSELAREEAAADLALSRRRGARSD